MRGTEFAELTAFMAVADKRSFARAAADLGIAPSTLSQTIRALEERLGVRLLNRTTRSVAPTEAGLRLLTELQPAFESVGRAVEGINAFRDKPAGTLRLLMGRAIANAAIAPMIAPFLTAYPEIKLDIVSDDGNIDIVSGRFDAGLRIGELIEKDMVAVRLVEGPFMTCVASPAYLAARAIPKTPDDLRAHACIRHRWAYDDTIRPWSFEKDGQHIDVAVDGPLIVNDLNLAQIAALAGAGIAYLPRGMLGRVIEEGRLVSMLDDWRTARSGVYIFYPSRRQVPAPLQAFIAFARKAVSPAAG
jgi:DNA-binding transcriptional LysR family regulator